MQTMYHGNLLGRSKPNDIFQEVLPNIVAAHVVQSYIGSYGAMVHPVAACATAAVSVEEGIDKIKLGKAELVVAGGIDDLTLEGIIGFGDMAATADTGMMRGRGIQRLEVLPGQRPAPAGLRRSSGWRHHPAGARRPGAQDGTAGARGGGLRAVVRRRCAHLDPGAGSRRAGRRPRRQEVAAGASAGQARVLPPTTSR